MIHLKSKTTKLIAIFIVLLLALTITAFTLTGCTETNCENPCACTTASTGTPNCNCSPPDLTMPCGCANPVLPSVYNELIRHLRSVANATTFTVDANLYEEEVYTVGVDGNSVFLIEELDNGDYLKNFLFRSNGNYYEAMQIGATNDWVHFSMGDDFSSANFFYSAKALAASLVMPVIENIHRFTYNNGMFTIRRGLMTYWNIYEVFEDVVLETTVRVSPNGNVLLELITWEGYLTTFYINIYNPTIISRPSSRLIYDEMVSISGEIMTEPNYDMTRFIIGYPNAVTLHIGYHARLSFWAWGVGDFDQRVVITLSGDTNILPSGFAGTHFFWDTSLGGYFNETGTVTITVTSYANPNLTLSVELTVVG